jgi:hypothetical protein
MFYMYTIMISKSRSNRQHPKVSRKYTFVYNVQKPTSSLRHSQGTPPKCLSELPNALQIVDIFHLD